MLFAALAGCSNRPTAMSVCRKLEDAHVAKDCKGDEPGGIGAAAKERVVFKLVESKKTGQVLTFESHDAYTRTVDNFEKMKKLAGPHRFGDESTLVFVQLNSEASGEEVSGTHQVLDGL
jgi:hypothetical protein